MSQNHSLKASTRKRSGSSALKQMRREGLIPAVLYGSSQENVNIKVEAKRLTDLLHSSAGEHLLVNLEIEGLEGGPKLALIQDVQHNPITSAILHADFHAVRADEKIHASIPIELHGTPVGVKEGGVLEHQLHSIEVHCLPKDLPETVEADVSELVLGNTLKVGELNLPNGVTTSLDGDVVIALVSEPRVATEAEEAEEAAAEEPIVAGEEAAAEESEESDS